MSWGVDLGAPRAPRPGNVAELPDILKEMERRQRQDDRRLAPRIPNLSTLVSTAGLTYIEGNSATSPVVPDPVDAATIADGLWIIQGTAYSDFTGGDGSVRARLVTSTLSPISDWFESAVGATAVVNVPAHFAVFGDADAARMEWETVPGTGTPEADTFGATITGYLVGLQSS